MSDSVRPHRQQPTRLRCPWDSPGKNTGVGCHFLLQCMKVKKWKWSSSVMSDSLRPHGLEAYQAPLSMGYSRQEYWSGVPLPSPMYSAYKLNKQGDNMQPWRIVPNLEPACCSMSRSTCCFLTCIQVSQKTGKVVWYFHFFKNFPQFVVIHTVKGFWVFSEAEVDVFLEFSCFFL